MPSRKLQDSSNSSSIRSKSDRSNKNINYYLKSFRKPNLAVDKYLNLANKDVLGQLIKKYNLDSIDFGIWASQTMRYNFLLALFTGLYDLEKVLKFTNNNIGRGVLKLGYGSRGVPKAYAHFEPSSNYINLSRERRKDKVGGDDEFVREFKSGFGSLAHEYGHFLDYFFGAYSGGQTRSLTGGSVVLKKISLTSSPIKFDKESYLDYFENRILQGTDNLERTLMFKIFITLFLDSRTFRPTPFYVRNYKFAVEQESGYWIQFNEIWARLFEIYVSYKLKKLGIVNKFLVHENRGKYATETTTGKRTRSPIYATYSEIQKVEKLIDKLIDNFNFAKFRQSKLF